MMAVRSYIDKFPFFLVACLLSVVLLTRGEEGKGRGGGGGGGETPI